jgi:hypothetical protein
MTGETGSASGLDLSERAAKTLRALSNGQAKDLSLFLVSPFLVFEPYAASSPVPGENSDSNISAKIRQISVADRIPASFS